MLKIAIVLTLCAASFARSPTTLIDKNCIDESQMDERLAGTAVNTALEVSKDMNVKMNVAVVDLGANLKGFLRMDDAWLGSGDIAIKKAKTASFFNMNTGIIGNLSQPGGDLYNIEHSNGGLISFPGGIPIHNCKDELIGAVGVSGSTVGNDHAVAEAIVAAMKKHLHVPHSHLVLSNSRMVHGLALAGIDAGYAASKEKKVRMDLAVVDLGANLQGFLRMDDAWLGSVDISIKKAKTAAFFNMNTEEIGKLSQPGGDLYNIEHSNGGLISFPGGIPVRNSKNELIGAVGVSGDTVVNDHAVAEAMVKAMKKAMEKAK